MKTFIVDSFTEKPFKGNPAGVCLTDASISDHSMLLIAQELNLSETAFVSPLEKDESFSIRYFSPKMEIPLCGHATLAASKVLFSSRESTNIQFTTIEGLKLNIQRSGDEIRMEFPIYQTEVAEVPPALLRALGIGAVNHSAYNPETKILLLEISDPKELSRLTPDFAALVKSHDSIHGVLVTAASNDDEYDFYSRYFWPWSGTNEDPVTGGTHTFLAPYWSQRLGKKKLKSFQCSQRTGSMNLEITETKLLIQSKAVIIFSGELIAEI